VVFSNRPSDCRKWTRTGGRQIWRPFPWPRQLEDPKHLD
jgi:hypothetical protein